jgi:hypothetical protein
LRRLRRYDANDQDVWQVCDLTDAALPSRHGLEKLVT